MSFRTLNTTEVAQHLNLTEADVDRLVKDGDIPFEKRGNRVIFRQTDIDAWVSQRILKFSSSRLAEYHEKSSQRTRKLLQREALLPDLIKPAYIVPDLSAKTKASVVRDMAALADRTGLVSDPAELVAGLLAREKLCSTAMPGGVAFLHPRQQQPYLLQSSFLVLGRTIQPIHFGSPDGQPTDLFFLLCCQGDILHLHALARLCMMVQKTDLLTQLRAAGSDASAFFDHLLGAEQAVIATVADASGRRPIEPPTS